MYNDPKNERGEWALVGCLVLVVNAYSAIGGRFDASKAMHRSSSAATSRGTAGGMGGCFFSTTTRVITCAMFSSGHTRSDENSSQHRTPNLNNETMIPNKKAALTSRRRRGQSACRQRETLQ